jgi:cellulose synthase/poly-beta-1,6-N-acetylglucosamine synthase-like glycosyltransferase
VVVPAGTPRTKPRALNCGLALARGELLCVYDAEDIPDAGQLRLAAETFAAAPAELACLQARLGWYNARRNWLTGFLELEYGAHFDVLLPALARRGWPLPLGGTSNHFRVSALRAAGGWDAWNVTEDADLGLRLARLGHGAGMLASETAEEACARLGDWFGQRVRWIKGWMQTWLVHLGDARGLARSCGRGGFFVLHAVIGASVLSALGYPVFTGLYLGWLMWGGGWGLPGWIYAGVFVAGHVAAMMAALAGACRRGHGDLVRLIPLLPLYWLLISAAAWRALAELVRQPHHWRKTPHGRELRIKPSQSLHRDIIT